MSGGSIARGGFRYQDLYLLLRVLKTVAREVDQALSSATASSTTVLGGIKTKFGIEARSVPAVAGRSGDETRDWDVVVSEAKHLELIEVKSGQVSKPDRRVFWTRVRREFGTQAIGVSEIHPRLVVDPDRIDDLQRWSELAAEARKFRGKIPKRKPSGNVTETTGLLKEALWHLCGDDGSGLKAVSHDAAVLALSRFSVETHKSAELNIAVTDVLDMFFPGVLTEQNKNCLLYTSPSPRD